MYLPKINPSSSKSKALQCNRSKGRSLGKLLVNYRKYSILKMISPFLLDYGRFKAGPPFAFDINFIINLIHKSEVG